MKFIYMVSPENVIKILDTIIASKSKPKCGLDFVFIFKGDILMQ